MPYVFVHQHSDRSWGFPPGWWTASVSSTHKGGFGRGFADTKSGAVLDAWNSMTKSILDWESQ